MKYTLKHYIVGTIIGLIVTLVFFWFIHYNPNRGPDRPLNFSMESKFSCGITKTNQLDVSDIISGTEIVVARFMGGKSLSDADNRKEIVKIYLKELKHQDEDSMETFNVCCEKLSRSLFDGSDNNDFCYAK